MNPMVDSGRTFVTGGSGFIGKAVISSATRPVRALVHKTSITTEEIQLVHGNLLDSKTPMLSWLNDIDSILHLARPAASTDRQRRRKAKQTALSAKRLLKARQVAKIPAVAVHGSLSYGHRGDELVYPNDPISPIGYAEAYAIGEAPWREVIGENVTLVRAPWVLGAGSWFELLYMGESVPVFEDGSMWMSIVDVNAFANWLWELMEKPLGGVLHPPLLRRFRQIEFANIISEIRSIPVERWDEKRLKNSLGKQGAASVLASLRIDDGREKLSESEENDDVLRSVIQSILRS